MMIQNNNCSVLSVWKLCILASIILSTTTIVAQANPETPPNKYYIGIPTFTQESLQISLVYDVANHSPLENYQYKILSGSDCPGSDGANTSVNADGTTNAPVVTTTDVTQEPYLQIEFASGENFQEDGDGNSYQSIQLNIAFDPDKIRGSPILTDTEGSLTAQVGFCVQLSTMTAEPINPGAIPLFYRETYITLDILQDGQLAPDGTVIMPKDEYDALAKEQYYLEGYLCDIQNIKIDNPEPIYLGQAIRVCVTPNEAARSAGIYMRAIEQFSWTRGSIHQQAIYPVQMPAHLTEVECVPGQEVCAFTTFLKAAFFYKLGSTNGAGTGWLQFGNSSSRQRELNEQVPIKMEEFPIHDNDSDRSLQELTEGVEGPGSPGYAGGGPFVVEHPLTRLYTAIGFLCDADKNEISPIDNPLTKGMKARVCVRPDALAVIQDNVRIRSIDRFTWTRPELGNTTQVAITTNAQAEDKTEIFCTSGSEVCAFETMLNDEFFDTTGVVEGKGIVWLQFGSDAQGRQLQTGVEYDLGFELLPEMKAGFAGASPYDAYVVVLPPPELRELYNCRVYECEGSLGNLTEIKPGEPKTQGSSIRMCVEPSVYAMQAGANMWSIEWWTWQRQNYTQPAIVEQGQEAPDGMTLQVCRRGDPVCMFQTRLQNDFFKNPGAMFGEGYCWLTFGKGEIVRGVISSDNNNTTTEEGDEEEVEKINPADDLLYAGGNDISYEFPVTGNYKFVLQCPEPDHKLTVWWDNLEPIQRYLIWASIIGSALSLCCLGFCCCFSAYRSERREYVETTAGKVTVNVDIADHTTTNLEKSHNDHA